MKISQYLMLLFLRPYIRRELPGWGKVYELALGYRRDVLWRDAPILDLREKDHGYVTRLDLSLWQDRLTFFLGRWHDRRLKSFLKDHANPNATVVDIGANRGSFSLFATRVSKQVIAFEPNPRMTNILEEAISRNHIQNLELYNFALGETDGVGILSVPRYNSGEASLSEIQGAASVNVPVRKGDDLFQNVSPTFIKIDVEGFETRVVKGLASTLRMHRPIVVTEVARRHLERCSSSPEELAEFMKSLGYRGYKLIDDITTGYKLIAYNVLESEFDVAWFPDPLQNGNDDTRW